MSSDSGISAARGSSTDLYAHCHSIPSPSYADFESTEKTIVEILTKNKTATTIETETLSNYEVIKVADSDVSQIMPICHPYDAIEKDAVLASVFKNNEVTFGSSSVTLSNSVVNTLSVEDTTTSIYDSVVRVRTTINPLLYSTDDAVEVNFDLANSHAALQYAVNSQYNTKLNIIDMNNANVYPTYVQEDTEYNTEKAFGKNYNQFIDSIDQEGKPVWSDYSENQPSITDKFILSPIDHRDENNNVVDFDNNDNLGIFKVTVFVDPKPFKTDLEVGSSLANTLSNVDVDDSTIKPIPLFHETNSLSNEVQEKLIDTNVNVDNSKFLLPSTDLSQDEMLSLIHSTNRAMIQPNFSFKVEISSNEDSGYSFEDSSYNLVSIDDSELNDSLIYMKEWVNHPHSLTLSEGNLSLAVDTNGMSSVIEEISFAGEREKLPSGKAGVDGVISLNSHTLLDRHSSIAQTEGNNTQVAIYYTNDTIPSGLSKVDDILCTTPEVSFGWQKVMEATSVESVTNFRKNSDTTLNLVSGNNIINETFVNNVNKFSYVFNSNNLPEESATNNVELWEITSGLNLLAEPNRIVSDTNVLLEGVNSSVILKSATRAFNDLNREIRQKITLKDISELGITNNIESCGWNTSLLEGASILESSSTSAYSVLESLPTYDLSLFYMFMANDNTNAIPYKLEYKTTNEASQLGSLSDFFEISYTYNNGVKTFIIVENEMTTIDLVKQDGLNEDVPDGLYNFLTTGTPIYNKVTHKLVKHTLRSTYRRRFKFPLGQYDNYELTTPLIKSETISYSVFVRSTNTPVSGSRPSTLSRVRDLSNGGFYSKVYQTVSPVDSSKQLVIEGMLSKQDLKEVYVTTQGKNINTQQWEDISEPVESSIFYGLESEPVINDIKLDELDEIMPGSNNVETTLYVTEYEDSGRSELVVKLNRPSYTIPLVIDYSANVFSLKTFRTSSDKTEIDEKTNLGSLVNTAAEELSEKVLDINNLYNVIKPESWELNPSDYKIVTSIVGNDVTIKVVKTAEPEDAIISIGISDNFIFVGQFLVSSIKKDVIRKRSLIGSSYTEVFVEAEPDMSSFAISNGIYLNKINVSELLPLGSYQLFELKKDLLNYNLVGGTLGGSYAEITSLGPFQWEDGEAGYYSDSFSLSKYRGHGHSSNTFVSSSIDQYYTIVRPAIDATFMITKSENETLSQTYSNIYAGQEVVVDELKRNSNDLTPSNIGLRLTFNYSMPNSSEDRLKPVEVNGDDVTVKIENPLLSGFSVYNPISGRDSLVVQTIGNKTLKDYNIYTFDGDSDAHRYYDGPMRIRSSRVKLLSNNQNNEFTDNAMRYSITWKYSIDDTVVKVSRAKIANPENNLLDFVGNPENIGSNGSSWEDDEDLIINMSFSQAKDIGVNIGVHNIKFKQTAEVVPTDYYYVSSPAYYKYETMSTANNITLPYNYASQFVSNRVTKYVPYITTEPITPFKSIVYSDMLKNTHSVLTNNAFVNDNMTFKILDPRQYADLHFEPNNVKNEIKFFGSRMKIDFLKNGNVVKAIYDDFITDLTENLNNDITLVSSNINSGIKFMIRQPISQIGYEMETDNDFELYYNTTDKSKWFPFKFALSNVNMFSQADMTFNMLAGPGTYPLLYTVKDVLSYDCPEILYRRVYKYESDTSMDFDSDATPMKTSLLFSTRKYVDVPVSMLSSSDNFNVNRFSQMLANITIPSSIQWINDSAFNNLNTNVKVSLLYGSAEVSKTFRRECFYVNNTETVFTLIHYSPFITMVNQVGMPLYNVQWNGLLKVPEVLSESFVLSDGRSRNVITNQNMTVELAKHTNLRL